MSALREIAKAVPAILERVAPAAETARSALLAEVSASGKITQAAKMLDTPANRLARSTAMEEVLSSRPLIMRDRKVLDSRNPGDMRSGQISFDDGTVQPVVVRSFDQQRQGKELATYGLHRISPFEHSVPTSVLRSDVSANPVLVQERLGRSVFDRAAMLVRREGSGNVETVFNRLMNASTDFANKVEDAVVERSLFGDMDTHLGNISLATSRGNITVGSIDAGQSWSQLRRPFYPRIAMFEGRPLSSGALQKTEEFVDILSSRRTKPLFEELGLGKTDVSRLIGRGKWMLDNRRLPSPMDL